MRLFADTTFHSYFERLIHESIEVVVVAWQCRVFVMNIERVLAGADHRRLNLQCHSLLLQPPLRTLPKMDVIVALQWKVAILIASKQYVLKKRTVSIRKRRQPPIWSRLHGINESAALCRCCLKAHYVIANLWPLDSLCSLTLHLPTPFSSKLNSKVVRVIDRTNAAYQFWHEQIP